MSDHGKIIRVEMAYADGAVQRLTGKAAELWLEEVDSIIIQAHIRYSQSPMSEHLWEWSGTKTD